MALGARFRAPAFWHEPRSLVSDAALPLAAAYTAASWLREATAASPVRAAVPVLCVGSVLVGGTGKTPIALALAERLTAQASGLRVHFLSRGYGGSARGPLRVLHGEHDSTVVGDEPLLLASRAPTWVGARRCDSASAACDAGAELLVMDDGLQHLTLRRDLSLLCVDSVELLGNARVLPAGPLREPLDRALRKADAVVALQPFAVACTGDEHEQRLHAAISDDGVRAALAMPTSMPLLRAAVVPDPASAAALRGAHVVAFSGTARPQRFFAALAALGCTFAQPPLALPDHAPLADEAINALRDDAHASGAALVTTRKDYVRLSAAQQREAVDVLDIHIEWSTDGATWLDELTRPLLQRAEQRR